MDEYKEIKDKVRKAYKNCSIFGEPERNNDNLYFWLLCGNNKKMIIWNMKTDVHQVIINVEN